MEEFPSDVELNVAAALLLLSHPPTITPPPPSSCNKLSKDTSIETTPCNSSLTTVNSVRAHFMKLMDAAASPCRMMQLKVARRARSKVIYMSSGDRKPGPSSWSKPPAEVNGKAVTPSETTTASSCLSTGGTSEISSGRKKRRVGFTSTHIGRRAEAIMRMLSGGECASEVRIRQLLGDSPDTSKALRMLLRMDVVKRSGNGGRADPFIYMMAAATG